ncbi:NUDIX domain-containing protein [Saccharopolyspora taberi]|uniref:8-oxo-dGTP diphosphatase n=1 Tax=Saccharopolyspora taberi TaxID=60895 RepID=A0ABN3VKJ4_9PSEU
MSALRSTGLINAPLATAGAALRHTRTAETGLAGIGVRARALTDPAQLLVPGDELAFRVPALGVPLTIRTRIVRAEPDVFSSVLVSGPFRELRHESTLTASGGRTLVTDEVRWRTPFGSLGRIADTALVRRWILAAQDQRLAAVREVAESWAERKVVVGTAIVHKGRMLAQQRRYPARDAGRWELPGGRVEPGESEQDAVVRECAEELDVEVTPTGRIGTDVPLDNGMLLRIHAARLVDPEAAPRAVEHHEVRWIDAGELVELDWLDADKVLVHSLRDLLRRR